MKWVSVDERLPKKSGLYQVKCNDIVNEWEEGAYAYICPEYDNVIWEDEEGEDFVPIVTEWLEIEE